MSGEEVPANSHCSNDCYYDIPSVSIEPCHHAQGLFGFDFSSIGSGFYVTQANYTVEGQITKATKDGDTVAYDITAGKITAQFTIQGTGGSGTPTLDAPDSTTWFVTSPLTLTNPDASYETYSVTFTKNLSHHVSSNMP